MDKVELDAGERDHELPEAVEPGLVDPPVVGVPPVGDEALHVGEVAAVLPAPTRPLVRPARALEALPEIGQHGLGNVDGERTRGVHQVGSFLGAMTPLPARARFRAAAQRGRRRPI
jgi:hypothetical protein